MADCNNPAPPLQTYNAPQLCMPSFRLQADTDCGNTDATYAEKLAAEALEIAGVQVNIFKLLGIHEQGKLIDLLGHGYPLSSGTAAGSNISSAFDTTIGTIWRSSAVGPDVINSPAYLGYYFGEKLTPTGANRYGRHQFNLVKISTIKIRQSPNAMRRATRIRLDRATGDLTPSSIDFIGTGNGYIYNITPGLNARPATITLIADTATSFTVIHSILGAIGTANTATRFNHPEVSFSIAGGNIPFATGDAFAFSLDLTWLRVDIQNVAASGNLETINFNSTAAAPYWRIVPVQFAGGLTDPWEIDEIQMMDYEQTSLDNIQDMFFQENRDRDYASCSLALRAQYTPFDSIGDLGKFGLSVLDQYVFTVSFARMIEVLGRPIVTGDILELPVETQWDHNMKPVKKYLEVTDTGWSSEGFTPGWKPILYRFQAVQMTPSQENRDIVGTADSWLNTKKTSDQTFFDQFDKPIATLNTEASIANGIEAAAEAPEQGQDPSTIASGEALLGPKGTPDNHDLYIEDGLPPDGLPYGEGYKLPDIAVAHDGDYFRMNYPADTGIPARLYKFNGVKGKWQYVETDRRMERSSFKKSVRKVLTSGAVSLKG